MSGRRLLMVSCAAAIGMSPSCAAVPPDDRSPVGGATGGGPGRSNETSPATCGAPRASQSFDVFKIADAATTGGVPSIVLGADGTPLIVFLVGEPGQERIVAAHLGNAPGGGAPDVQIIPLSQAGPTLTRPRIAATHDGGIAGVYTASSEDGSLHGRFLRWSGRIADPPVDTQPVPDPIDLARPAIVVDGSDRPTAAFVYLDFSMRLVWSPGEASPSRETVEIGVDPFSETLLEMTLDSNAQPVLAATSLRTTPYASGTNTFIPSSNGYTVWRRGDGGWTRERVAVDSAGGGPFQIRLSPAGDLMIFFAGAGLSRVVRHDGKWREELPIVDGAGRAPQVDSFDVTFGPTGELQVVFSSFDGLGHAVFDGCHWSATTIFDVGGANPSVAIDPAGRSHIAFQKTVGVIGVTETVISEVWYARPRS